MLARLFIDPPAEGAWNMAVDAVLVRLAARDDLASVRFYQWREPTLSLGYFQRFAGRDAHAASAGCPVVRRATGGGAILHDRELTYSLALPQSHPLARDPLELYDAAHATLRQALARFTGQSITRPAASPGPDPFLCFQRRSSADLVIGDTKLAGSAQRRIKGAVLQHGSVILERSPRAPEIAGLSEVSAVIVKPLQLLEAWQPLLAERLNWELIPSELSAAERDLATVERERFRSDAWLKRR